MTTKESPKNVCFICDDRQDGFFKNDFLFEPQMKSKIQTELNSNATLTPTAVILENILEINISNDLDHSNILCSKCAQQCNEYDQLNQRLLDIRASLMDDYGQTICKYSKLGEITIKHDEDTLPNAATPKNSIVSIAEGGKKFKINGKDIVLSKNAMKRVKKVKLDEPQKPEQLPEQTNTTGNEEILFEEIIQQDCFETGSDEQLNYVNIIDSNNAKEYFDQNDENMVEISTENDGHFEQYIEIPDDCEDETLNDFEIIDVRTANKFFNEIKTESNVTTEITCKSIFSFEGGKFTCQLCSNSDVTYDTRTMTIHLKTLHDEKVYICEFCGSDYRKKGELTEHLEEHAEDGEHHQYKCEECNRIFDNLRVFRLHKKMHIPATKSWECKECKKKYTSKNLLDEHMNMHTGDRPYQCTHCSKDFASKYTLTAHLKIHSERKRPHECIECSKSFFSHQNLIQHQRTHTGVKEFVCLVCDKAFGTAHNLDVHKIVHTGYKPFICRRCGKAFARRAEIKDHERTHTGERPYHCDICGSSFAQRSNLMSHKRATHLNDKRYKCDQCDKSFKRRRLLEYHIKASHTGERPYHCEICGSSFVYPEHYKKHLRIHSGVKPFKCEVCGKAFNSRDNRNAHRFVHSEKKPYECLFCGQGFMRKPLLMQHMKSLNHENDRIVLNQPHLDSQKINTNDDGDEEGNEKNDSTDEIIYELATENGFSLNDDGIISEELNEADEIEMQNNEEDLIIDGQVQIAEQDISYSNDENNDVSVDIGELSNKMYVETEYIDEIGETEFIESSDGSAIQLVQIRVSNPSGQENTTWVNLVPQ